MKASNTILPTVTISNASVPSPHPAKYAVVEFFAHCQFSMDDFQEASPQHKSSRTTQVEAALAVIKASKPLKKGKREPEDLETKVNLKKQKKDVIAAVQKDKSEKKVPKKVESSDDSGSSDSEEEKV